MLIISTLEYFGFPCKQGKWDISVFLHKNLLIKTADCTHNSSSPFHSILCTKAIQERWIFLCVVNFGKHINFKFCQILFHNCVDETQFWTDLTYVDISMPFWDIRSNLCEEAVVRKCMVVISNNLTIYFLLSVYNPWLCKTKHSKTFLRTPLTILHKVNPTPEISKIITMRLPYVYSNSKNN